MLMLIAKAIQSVVFGPLRASEKQVMLSVMLLSFFSYDKIAVDSLFDSLFRYNKKCFQFLVAAFEG